MLLLCSSVAPDAVSDALDADKNLTGLLLVSAYVKDCQKLVEALAAADVVVTGKPAEPNLCARDCARCKISANSQACLSAML